MNLKISTFNLYQFAKPPFYAYDIKEKLSLKQWEEKTKFLENQLLNTKCDIIGFQEVFSVEELEKIVKKCGFKYFCTIEKPKLSKSNKELFTKAVVALASKYEILDVKNVKIHTPTLKKYNFKGHFKFTREVLKASIKVKTHKLLVYVAHFKSNRLNEFEYEFTKTTLLNEKKNKFLKAINNEFSSSLLNRVCEASSIYFDIKKELKTASIVLADINDKEFSITIEALCNSKFHFENSTFFPLLYDASYFYKKKVYNPHPEQKELKREATSYFTNKGNVLDYIFLSKHFCKKDKNALFKVVNYEVFNHYLKQKTQKTTSDHAQVVCQVESI